jgi:hypothetical protein
MNKKIKDFNRRVLKISKETGVILPQKDYFGIIPCYSCGKEILIFTWLNDFHEDYEGSGFAMYSQSIPDEKNKPKTVKYVKSTTINKSYWENNCPYCNALQGDFFLHAEPDYPFL